MWSNTILSLVICALAHILPSSKSATADDRCGETIGCLRYPSGCELSKCSYLATYRSQGDQVTFELRGKNAEWVAIGFSDDQLMPDTDSVFCYKSNGNVLLRSGFLDAKSLPTLKEEKDLTFVNGSVVGGSIQCRFSRPIQLSTSKLRSLENDVYLLYAKGNLRGDDPGYHGGGEQNRGFTAERVNIKRNLESTATAPSDLKKRVHGSLMVVVWIFLASTGLFFARYTRNNWSDSTLFDQKVWFQFHRFIMITVVLGTISSIIVIFVDLDGFTEGKDKIKAHAILGLVVLSLATLQPIGALFRPHPGTSKRPIFNFFHRTLGLSAFIISLAATILGLDIFEKKNAFYLVIGYAVFLVLVIMVMEIVKLLYEKKEQETTAGRRYVEIELKGLYNDLFG